MIYNKIKLVEENTALAASNKKTPSDGLVENLKKAVTEILILSFLNIRSMPIYEILNLLDEKSHSMCKISYPYAAIYRLLDANCIVETKKQQAKDNRRRQYYKITKKGIAYLLELRRTYAQFIEEMQSIFNFVDNKEEDQNEPNATN